MEELLFDSLYYKMFLKETEKVHDVMLYMKNSFLTTVMTGQTCQMYLYNIIHINTFLSYHSSLLTI